MRLFCGHTLDALEQNPNHGCRPDIVQALIAEVRLKDLEMAAMASIDSYYGANAARLEAAAGDLTKLVDEVAVYKAVRAERERLRDWHKAQLTSSGMNQAGHLTRVAAHRASAEFIQAAIDESAGNRG